jgi:hypothetical protein
MFEFSMWKVAVTGAIVVAEPLEPLDLFQANTVLLANLDVEQMSGLH